MEESLTVAQTTAFFKAHASRCPHCGEPVTVHERFVDCSICYEECSCTVCDKRWTNHYTLAEVQLNPANGEVGPRYQIHEHVPLAAHSLIATYYACKAVLDTGNDDELSKFQRIKRLLEKK